MAEYIERKPRYIDIKKFTIPRGFFNQDLNVPKIFDLLYSQPTADVVEVKHGEWIAYRNPVEVVFICSECKYRYFFADPEEECEYNFCPHCGAKMDLKEGAVE